MKKQDMTRVGVVGTGNMGGALLRGLAAHYPSESIGLYDIDGVKAAQLARDLGVSAAPDMKNLVDNSRIIVLAVKPDVIVPVLEEIKIFVQPQCVVISIAAGITIAAMQKSAGQRAKIIRAMPNTPAMVGEGMTVLSSSDAVTEDELGAVRSVFQCVGRVLELPEKLMDAVTALSGSGPAFAFTFIQAMADGGVKMGIPRDRALLMAAQTVMGAAKMLLAGGDDPMTLRGKVTSPGGTTIEGIHVLERAGFSGIVMDAVEKAAMKSKKLGEG